MKSQDIFIHDVAKYTTNISLVLESIKDDHYNSFSLDAQKELDILSGELEKLIRVLKNYS